MSDWRYTVVVHKALVAYEQELSTVMGLLQQTTVWQSSCIGSLTMQLRPSHMPGEGKPTGAVPMGLRITPEEGPEHIAFRPTNQQFQCIDSKLKPKGDPPSYYWAQFRSNASR
jgi:hypothetical protein